METLEIPNKATDPRACREAEGLSAARVAERMRTELGERSRHFTSVTKMEKVGSYNVKAIRAYANAVGIDFHAAIEMFESIALRILQEKKSKL